MKQTILGIDTGSTKIGYGAISFNNSDRPKAIGYGYISLEKIKDSRERLYELHKDLKKILKLYNPAQIAIENLYFFKNAKTFTPVIQSKGIILFTSYELNIDAFEYTPLQVKQTICGYGRATKDMINKLVKSSLHISSNIKPDDASDALAIALCHLRHLTGS